MTQHPLAPYGEPLRRAYLVLLASIATADHENSEGEVAFMQALAASADLSEASAQEVAKAMQAPASINYAQHIALLQGSDLKYAFMADVSNLLYADGDLDAQETAQVARLNSALGITDQQFGVLQQYVKKANAAAEASEGTPGIQGLLGGGGGGGGFDLGGLLGMAGGFLSQSGLAGQFQQAGIPTSNFESGSTIGTVLSGLATSFLQSKLGGAAQPQGGGMGDMLGGMLGSMLGGSNPGTQSRGIQNPAPQAGGGLGGLVAGVLSSPQGQDMVKGILGQIMGSNQQGRGLPNMSSAVGGGRKSADTLGGLMGMLLQ